MGLNESLLREMLALHLTEDNLNEFGRFDQLKECADKAQAKDYFEKKEGKKIPLPMVNVRLDNVLREFLLNK